MLAATDVDDMEFQNHIAEITSTTDADRASQRIWDAIVIGAGPAGCSAALLLARAGRKVLIVERSEFPRFKVCGCCLSGRAVSELHSLGLGAIPKEAVPLQHLILAAGQKRVTLEVHGGAVLSRERLDVALLQAAVSAGAEFLSDHSATTSTVSPDWRTVSLSSARTKGETLRARLVLCSRGLNHPSDSSSLGPVETIAGNSKIGVAAILSENAAYSRSTTYMASGSEGYVGLVRLEDGRLNIAAAIPTWAIRKHAGVPNVIRSLLHQVGFSVPPGLEDAHWKGTPALTRSLSVPADQRLFYLGDSAGYVEPFTGEGIGWALASARAVVPLAESAIRGWDDEMIGAWKVLHHKTVKNRQIVCRVLRRLLEYPILVREAVRCLGVMPRLARPLTRSIHGSRVQGRI